MNLLIHSLFDDFNLFYNFAVDPTSTTTEMAGRNDMKVPNVNISSASSSNTIQLLMVFGGILVALVLLFLGILLSFFIKQRSSLGDNSTEGESSKPDSSTKNELSSFHCYSRVSHISIKSITYPN